MKKRKLLLLVLILELNAYSQSKIEKEAMLRNEWILQGVWNSNLMLGQSEETAYAQVNGINPLKIQFINDTFMIWPTAWFSRGDSNVYKLRIKGDSDYLRLYLKPFKPKRAQFQPYFRIVKISNAELILKYDEKSSILGGGLSAYLHFTPKHSKAFIHDTLIAGLWFGLDTTEIGSNRIMLTRKDTSILDGDSNLKQYRTNFGLSNYGANMYSYDSWIVSSKADLERERLNALRQTQGLPVFEDFFYSKVAVKQRNFSNYIWFINTKNQLVLSQNGKQMIYQMMLSTNNLTLKKITR